MTSLKKSEKSFAEVIFLFSLIARKWCTKQQQEARKLGVVILLALVYVVGIAGIAAMKKIQPEDKIYPIWVVFVCVVVTCFVIWHVS